MVAAKGEIMTYPTAVGLAAVALLALAPAAVAETPPPLSPAVATARIAGSGLNVIDLEAQKAW